MQKYLLLLIHPIAIMLDVITDSPLQALSAISSKHSLCLTSKDSSKGPLYSN